MKILYIVRHAKSSWDDLSLSDHDRGLLPMGEKRTGKIAEWLKSKGIVPDKIISSTAVRAYETARILARGINYPEGKIEKQYTLYNSDPEDVLQVLYGLSDEVKTVMVVGHNPAFTDLANLFLKGDEQLYNLPTSAVVAIKFNTNHWNEIDLAKHKVEFLITPKMLK